MQNKMPMTTGRLKSKLEVAFQYDSRSFSQTGRSYNLGVACDIFKKFGTLRDPDLLRTCVLPNWNRMLIRDVNGRCKNLKYRQWLPIWVP